MQEVINKIAELTEEDVESLSLATVLGELEAWDSLAQVSFLAFAAVEFDVELDALGIRSASTIGDLCNLVLGESK